MSMNTATFENTYLSLIKDNRIFDSSLHESAGIIAKQCALALSASRASVWVAGETNSKLHCLSLYIKETDCYESGAVLDREIYPGYFEALANERVIDARDTFTDLRTCDLAESYLIPLDVRSLLDATLRHQGKVNGVLCFEMVGQQRDWTREEQVFVASVGDLVSQRLIVEKLIRSEEKYKALYEHTNDGIGIFGDSVFKDVNPAACKIFGGERHEIIGKTSVDLSPEFQSDGQPSLDKAMSYIQKCLNGETQNFEWTHKRLNGEIFQSDITLNAIRLAGKDTFFSLIRDITDRKKVERQAAIAQEKLEFRAAHDTLTGLQNREQLHEYVSHATQSAQKTNNESKVALLLLDLNRFKEVNDTLGHATGDKVLVKLSIALNERVKDIGGSLFRLGGDEFVAVFSTDTCAEPFEKIESILHQCLKTTIDVDDVHIELGASIGIAIFPDNGKNSHELLRCADVAMYYAKNNNNGSSWYDSQNDLNNKRRLAMTVELRSAINEDQLVLHFQPRIHLQTGEITGCEALLRWSHPKLGMVPPGEFLPLTEMSELIHPLSEWVLQNAIRQVERMLSNGYRIPVAMNVSARNLTDSRLADSIEKIILDKSIQPDLLEIEITESALINHPQRAVENLEKINQLGIPIAIDDFGTGYSSLSYLKKLPLSTLKIDRSFVRDMLTDESDSVIVDSTINLAHNFSLTVVAEGVEDQQTLDELAAKDCDQAQGFLIAKPMSADDFDLWLEHNANRLQTMRLAS